MNIRKRYDLIGLLVIILSTPVFLSIGCATLDTSKTQAASKDAMSASVTASESIQNLLIQQNQLSEMPQEFQNELTKKREKYLAKSNEFASQLRTDKYSDEAKKHKEAGLNEIMNQLNKAKEVCAELEQKAIKDSELQKDEDGDPGMEVVG